MSVKLYYFIIFYFILFAPAHGFELSPKIKNNVYLESAAARQVHIGNSVSLLAFEEGDRALQVVSFNAKKSRINQRFLATGLNLVESEGAFAFSAFDGWGNCSIQLVKKDKAVSLFHEDSCFAEVFPYGKSFVAIVRKYNSNSLQLLTFKSNFSLAKKIQVEGIDGRVTGFAVKKDRIFLISQNDALNKGATLWEINGGGKIQNRTHIPGIGGQVMNFSSGLLVSYNSKEGVPHLSYMSSDFKSEWDVEVYVPKGSGTRAALLSEGDKIYYVAGNNWRIYVAVFDGRGKKEHEILGDETQIPDRGYSVALQSGKLEIIGLIASSSNTPSLSSRLVHYSLDLSK